MEKRLDILTITAMLLVPFGLIFANMVHQGHLYTLIVFIFIGLAFALPNQFLTLFVLYVAGWLAYILSLNYVGGCISAFVPVILDGSLFFLFFFLFFLSVFHSKISQKTWFNVICISAFIQALIGICQLWFFDPITSILSLVVTVTGDIPFSTPVGTLGNNNFLGAYLAISLPFFFRSKWWMLLPAIVYGIFITHTTAAGVAALVGVAFFFGGWWTVLLISISTVIYLYFYDFTHIFKADRFLFWKDAFIKVTHSFKTFMFGFGPGITWEKGNQLHNEYVATLFNFGIVGLSLLIGYIVTVYKDNKILFTALLITCVNMLGNHPLHTTPSAMLILVIVALIEKERINGYEK